MYLWNLDSVTDAILQLRKQYVAGNSFRLLRESHRDIGQDACVNDSKNCRGTIRVQRDVMI